MLESVQVFQVDLDGEAMKEKETEEMERRSGASATAVLAAIGAYIGKAHEATRGQGPTILEYAHIMELVETMDGDEAVALLWKLVPRYLQAAVDIEQVAQRSSSLAEMMRHGYPPVGVPPCEPVEPAKVLRKDATSPWRGRDRLEGSVPTEHGAAIRQGEKGELLLVLEFYPEDVDEWFAQWLNLENQFAKGISLGVAERFDLDSPMLGRLKSRGWRERSCELQIRWDDGYILFRRVLPIQVKQEGEGASVVVVFLIDGGWSAHEDYHDDEADDEADDDYSIDHETGQVMRPARAEEPVDDEPEGGEGFPDAELQARFGVDDEEEVDDETK